MPAPLELHLLVVERVDDLNQALPHSLSTLPSPFYRMVLKAALHIEEIVANEKISDQGEISDESFTSIMRAFIDKMWDSCDGITEEEKKKAVSQLELAKAAIKKATEQRPVHRKAWRQ